MGEAIGMVSQVAGLMGSFGGGGEGGGGQQSRLGEAATASNQILQNALMQALPYSEGFTREAMDELRRSEKQARIDQEAGFQRMQGLTAPYRAAGYMALDDYLDTLSIARPEMGSLKLATALESAAKREQALGTLANEVERVREYQNIGGIGEVQVDPVTGQSTYMPGLYAENMLDMARDMRSGDWFPSVNAPSGYVPLSSAQGGYLPPKYQRRFGGMSGSLPGSARNALASQGPFSGLPPMSAIEQTDETIKDLQSALADYGRSTQYYTPEHGTIAASFNKGLFGDPRWVNVGTSPTQSLLANYGNLMG